MPEQNDTDKRLNRLEEAIADLYILNVTGTLGAGGTIIDPRARQARERLDRFVGRFTAART